MSDAQEALARGDTAAALTALQASIDAQPNSFAYIERIKINAKQGNDAAVEEDVQALLKIDPENRDIGWIRAEMKKPAASRFDANSKQPSMSK
jgi:predicted Zn-dependent protease